MRLAIPDGDHEVEAVVGVDLDERLPSLVASTVQNRWGKVYDSAAA